VTYGVATVSRLLQIISFFCNRALYKRLYSAKETYNFKEPTDCSHPIMRKSCATLKVLSAHHVRNEKWHILVSRMSTRHVTVHIQYCTVTTGIHAWTSHVTWHASHTPSLLCAPLLCATWRRLVSRVVSFVYTSHVTWRTSQTPSLLCTRQVFTAHKRWSCRYTTRASETKVKSHSHSHNSTRYVTVDTQKISRSTFSTVLSVWGAYN